MTDTPHPLPQTPFVAALVDDPANVPAVTVLTGYIGKAASDNHTRVYFDLALTRFVDVPTEAIKHHEAADSGLGAVVVWIDSEADVPVPAAGPEAKVKAREMVAGPMTAAYAAQQPAAGQSGPGAQGFLTIACTMDCPTRDPFFCETRPPRCEPHTSTIECQMTRPPNCPITNECTRALCPSAPQCPAVVGGAAGPGAQGFLTIACTMDCPTRDPFFCETRPPRCEPHTSTIECQVTQPPNCPITNECTRALCPSAPLCPALAGPAANAAVGPQAVAAPQMVQPAMTALPVCQTIAMPCPTVVPPCPTMAMCPTLHTPCPTGDTGCPTMPTGCGCPTEIPACPQTAACAQQVQPSLVGCPTHMNCPTQANCTIACPSQVNCPTALVCDPQRGAGVVQQAPAQMPQAFPFTVIGCPITVGCPTSVGCPTLFGCR